MMPRDDELSLLRLLYFNFSCLQIICRMPIESAEFVVTAGGTANLMRCPGTTSASYVSWAQAMISSTTARMLANSTPARSSARTTRRTP